MGKRKQRKVCFVARGGRHSVAFYFLSAVKRAHQREKEHGTVKGVRIQIKFKGAVIQNCLKTGQLSTLRG